MAGGKGKIKPEDGKQFILGNKAAEKWTEKEALKVGNDLISWLREVDEDGDDKGNMLFEEFLYLNNDYYPELISYLKNKFTSFLKLHEKAKKIQEIKLHKHGLADRLNASIVKFSLINNHGWSNENKEDNNPPKEVKLKFSFGDNEDE